MINWIPPFLPMTARPRTKAQGVALLCVLALQIGVVLFVLLFFLLSGCCHCPPHRMGDAPLAVDVIQWASLDSLSDAYADTTRLWRINVGPTPEGPRLIDFLVPSPKVYGPWPCRWLYSERQQCCAPVAPIRRYEVRNGQVTIWDEYIPAVAITYTVKDSVWHCDGDGVFTR